MSTKFSRKKRLLWIPPIIIGILALYFAPLLKQAPAQKEKTDNAKVVRIMNVVPRKIQPNVIGYGYIQPAHEWQAQSELSGTITWISDNLKDGAIIKKGELVVKIDSAPLLLEKAQLLAQLEVAKLKDTTTASSIKIAAQDVALQKTELARIEKLTTTGNISKTTKDASQRTLLNGQQQLQTLKNTLLINQAEQKVILAQLAMINLDIQKTQLFAPFDIRVTEVNVSIAKYINSGSLLLKADGLDAAEVSAQFPIGKMRPLRQTVNNQPSPQLTAIVQLQTADRKINWEGKVDRTGGALDPQTQSQSIVVRIDKPYEKAAPGSRPPLVRDTFVKVILQSPVRTNRLLIPETAIHNNQVYTLDEENTLRIKPIEIDFIQQQIAVLKSGVLANDRIILSPLSPAIEGMKLKPQEDKKMNFWLDKTSGFSIEKKSPLKEAL